MHKSLLVVCLFVTCSLWAQEPDYKRITRTLCSPEFHGRGYVNKGDSVAAAFMAEEFEKLGVGTYKNNGYLQHFTLKGVNTFPGTMSVEHIGKTLIPGKHYMVDAESAGGKMTLKPVILEGASLIDKGADTGFNGTYIQKQMAKLGTSGYNAILLNLSKVTGDSLRMLTGVSKALAQDFPVIEVINHKFTWAVGRKQLPNPLIYVQDSIVDMSGNFELNIEADFVDSYASQNVIAYLPSKKKCAKTILFTAHYDHLGRMGTDTYFPGANDNASGTSMLFTMAKHFKENPSDYNIMFIGFAGEEAGLEGSKYFVENTWLKLKKIEFLLNLDIMGSGEEGITVVNATVFEKHYELLKEINAEKELLAKVKRRGPTANSDHYWFSEAGVPAFFIYTMGPNKHYHDVFDIYSELSFNKYVDITTLLISFVEKLDTVQ